jgi:5-methyltetrahydrofolate--homocysteine methyltransferase
MGMNLINEALVTQISSRGKTVTIGAHLPTVTIGERINPLGKRAKAQAYLDNDMKLLRELAIKQVEAGADVLDVNISAPGMDEEADLPAAVKAVQEVVDVPLCIDTINPAALSAALAVYQGKALVNSVNGKQHCLEAVLPIVKEHGAAVVGLTMDETGIPKEPSKRLAIAQRIIETAQRYGIPKEDVIIDCANLAVGSVQDAAVVTLKTLELVREHLGVNMTLGASNVSFGLPDRHTINAAFLPIVIAYGVTCPMVDVMITETRKAILATDVFLARDRYASRFISYYRKTHQGS